MAGVDVRIVVEDVAAQLALGYDRIDLHRANSVDGTYASVATMTLVAGTFYYTINDPAGDLNKWYKYQFDDVTGTPASDFSDPFRVDGVTRLRARQGVLNKYNCGMVITSNGGDTDTVRTVDPRVHGTTYRTGRLKGSYIRANNGTGANQYRVIKDSTQAAGEASIELGSVWAAPYSVVSGEEFEIHHLASPEALDNAINRAMPRYYYVDRVPLPGVANQDEYPLSGIPWLIDVDQIHDVRWYPFRTSAGVDDGIDESWASNGRWWRIRKDGDNMVLRLSPTIDSTVQLWLETSRPMPPLYTDTAAAPVLCQEELVVALAYDELLGYLARPGNGTVEERKTWVFERRYHAPELHRLLKKHRPKPRYGPAQLTQPSTIPKPFSSR